MDQGRQLLVLGSEGEALAEARVRCGAGLDWIDLGATDDLGQLALPDRELDAQNALVIPRYLAVERAGYARAFVRETDAAVQVVRLAVGAELIGQLVLPAGLFEPFGAVRVFAWPEIGGAYPGLSSELVARIGSDPELVEAKVETSGAFRLSGLDPARNYSVRAIGGGWISSSTPNQRPGDGVCRAHLSKVYLLCLETGGPVSMLFDNEYESYGMRVFTANLQKLSTDKLDSLDALSSPFLGQVERQQLHSGVVPLPTTGGEPFAQRRSMLTSVSSSEAAWFCEHDLGHRGHRRSFGYGVATKAGEVGALDCELMVILGGAPETFEAKFAAVSAGGALLALRGHETLGSEVYPVEVRIETAGLDVSAAQRLPQGRVTFMNKADPQDAWVLLTDGSDQMRFWLPVGDYEMRYESAGGVANSKLLDVHVSPETPPVVLDWTHLGAIEIEWLNDAGMPAAGSLKLIGYKVNGNAQGTGDSAFDQSLSFPQTLHAPLLTIPHLPPATYHIEVLGKGVGTLISGGETTKSVTGNQLAFLVDVRAGEVARVKLIGK